MTLKELVDILQRAVVHHGDDQVVVETNHGGVPTRVMVAISQVMPGFDWTKGRFIFRTVDPVVPCKILKKKLSDFARERLAEREAAHRKVFGGRERGGEYLPKTHRQPWIDGFIAGVRWHITGVDLGDIGVGTLGDEWGPQDDKEAAAVQRCLHKFLQLTETETSNIRVSDLEPMSAMIAKAEAKGFERARIMIKRLLAHTSSHYGIHSKQEVNEVLNATSEADE
jgi:hypothetical protein